MLKDKMRIPLLHLRTKVLLAFLGMIITVPLWGDPQPDPDIAARHISPYPVTRLQRDWMYQDAQTLKVDACFTAKDSSVLEQKMVKRVLDELKESETDIASFQSVFDDLVKAKKSGNAPEWKKLYLNACTKRRQVRLEYFNDQPREYIYVKHFVFGDAQAMFAMSDHLTDAIFRETGSDYRMNSQLCRMTIEKDGSVTTKVLLDRPTGVIRDPSLSYDGKTLAFSMRKTDHNGGDDFHLYTMPIDSQTPTQITFGPGTADMDPEWLPDGNLVFTSTRCVFSAPCWWSSVCNLFTCDSRGRYIRRLGVDHGHTVFPHMTEDGRITYTRWEYSDRHAGYLHSLFIMNADGTNQTEFYGNNSQFPAAILHARNVPGTTKIIAISGAHHIDQRGKLIMIDRREGTQAGVGVDFLAPERPMPVEEGKDTSSGNIVYGTDGEQFQYPYPLDEDNYLVCYSPEGGSIRGLKGVKDGKKGAPPFGIYWMDRDGRRELLIYDPTISSGQQIAVRTRPIPPMRATAVNEQKHTGRFYVQNVYFGAAAEGIKPGTIKKMRIVALDYRAKGTIALGLHPWGGHQTSPCSINNGSYDVKHVLGTVDVEEDGSSYFECPSRVPVFFQLLDEKGSLVQNMRSWTLVLPGEQFSCIGCHEDKNSTFTSNKPTSLASNKPPQKIKPFFAPGDEPVQEMSRYLTDREKKAIAYLGPNAPQGMDVPTGFSYTREVQPIWDRHCIDCHSGSKNALKKDVPLSLLGDSRPVTNDEIYNRTKWRICMRPYGHGTTQGVPGRTFSESYINLTDFGYNAKIPQGKTSEISNVAYDKAYLSYFGNDPKKIPNPTPSGYSSDEYAGKGLINWLHVSSLCGMLPPYAYGSISSPLMKYLEPSHYGVQVSPKEKEIVACWIDLNVPYCGSWMELNEWDMLVHHVHSGLAPWYVYRDKLRQIYLYFEAKRLKYAELEVESLDKYIEHVSAKKEFAPTEFTPFNFGGQEIQKKFVEDYDRLPETVPIYGIAEGKDSRGGSNVQGNPVRNLAINTNAFTCSLRSYPRVTANSWYRYRPEFSPIHLIDGVTTGEKFWKPAKRTDLSVLLEFGRDVLAEKVVLSLHLNDQQEKTWTNATIEFSDGTSLPITLKCTDKPQSFVFPAKKCSWIKLMNLQQAFPLIDQGINELEVVGKDL